MDNEHDNCACNEYNELASRREFLTKSGGAVGAAAFALAFPEWLPQVSIAEAYIANRDVVVSIFLRGGADGLSLCVPFGDNEYYLGRPTLAIPRPDSTRRDSLALPRLDSTRLSRAVVPTDSLAIHPLAADSLRGDEIVIRGTLFGEPLHFLPADSGTYVAIGGVPVDAPRPIPLK